jgi:hypothetical protein
MDAIWNLSGAQSSGSTGKNALIYIKESDLRKFTRKDRRKQNECS